MTESQKPIVSIIIPALNEESRLPTTLRELLDYLSLQPYSSEVIVVDDGSTDGTKSVMAQFAEHDLKMRTVSYAPRQGKGYAVRSGMRVAHGRYLLFMDADLAYPVQQIEDILSAIDRGYQVVIGSRTDPGSRAEIPPPLSRRIASRLYNYWINLLGLSPYEDTQCGFKGFTRPAAEALFSRQRIKGFAFDAELIAIARRLELPIMEVPVALSDDSQSSVRMFRDGYKIIRDLWGVSRRMRKGLYDYPARRSSEQLEPGHSPHDLLDKGPKPN